MKLAFACSHTAASRSSKCAMSTGFVRRCIARNTQISTNDELHCDSKAILFIPKVCHKSTLRLKICRRERPPKPEAFSSLHTIPLSKKLTVTNSPWGRSFERASDCRRWAEQGHAVINHDNSVTFSKAFLASTSSASYQTRDTTDRPYHGGEDQFQIRGMELQILWDAGGPRMKTLQWERTNKRK